MGNSFKVLYPLQGIYAPEQENTQDVPNKELDKQNKEAPSKKNVKYSLGNILELHASR